MTKIEEAMKLIGPSCVCEVNLGNILLLTGALKEAIEQHEAFRQEVSDVISELSSEYTSMGSYYADKLKRFIITKPDPLVEAMRDTYPDVSISKEDADYFCAALAKRGLEIREKKDD